VSLHDVDFTESNLQFSVFNNCDFARAVFDNTNLEKTDFRTSINYQIHPEHNKINRARFSEEGLRGLLAHYNILVD
jgi:uncharacterized protein YjbI with pentapeptide repeats